MKPAAATLVVLVLGTALLAGCKREEPAAPAPVAEPAAPPAPMEPAPPAEPVVEDQSPTDVMNDPAVTDPNAPPAAPTEGDALESEESDAPHSGGDKV